MAALTAGIDAEALYWEALKGRQYFRHPWTPNYSQAETNKLRPLNRAAISRHWSRLWRLLKLQPIQPVNNSA